MVPNNLSVPGEVVEVALVLIALLILAVIAAAKLTNMGPRGDASISVAPDVSPAPPEEIVLQHTQAAQRDLTELLPSQFVVLDLETTGLSPTVHEIIEIGALKITLEMGQHPAFQMLVKPTKQIPRNIAKLTGITQAMVEERGIELRTALQHLMEFVGELPLVTYNAEFDMGFLWAAAKRCDLVFPNRYACALKRARRAFPDMPSHKLSYMAERFNLPDGHQHRAVGDCERAAHVFLLSTVALNQKVRWTAPAALDS